MAADPLVLERLGRPIPEAGMQIADVERLKPPSDVIRQREGTRPLPQPEALLLERANTALGIGVALRVVVAGEGLGDVQRPAGGQEAHRGRLTAVIAHQMQRLALDAVRELAIDGHVQGGQPVRGRGLQPDVVADELLRVPVEHHDHVDPAERFDDHFGHIDAPPLVGPGGPRLAARRGPTGLQAAVGRDQQAVRPHEAQDPFLVDRQSFDIVQRGPAAPVAPEGMRRF